MRLSAYPFVVVRVGCGVCHRTGQYRLARLAAKYGAEATLDEVMKRLVQDCPWREEPDRRKSRIAPTCHARFIDLDASPRPPDLPPAMLGLRLVQGGKGRAPAGSDERRRSMTYEERAVAAELDAHADSIRPGATAAELREVMEAVARKAYRTAIDDAGQCMFEIWNDMGGATLKMARQEVLRLPGLDTREYEDSPPRPQDSPEGRDGGRGALPLSLDMAEAELPF